MVPSRVRLVLAVGAILALIPLPSALRAQSASAQSSSQTKPAAPAETPRDFSQDIPPHLSFVEGQVTLERDNKLEPAETNLPLLTGDRIKTREGGRVEILFADSSTLAVDQSTQLDLLSDSLVRLTSGAVRLVIPRATEDLDYRVDAPGGYVEIKHAGEYRVDTGVNQQGTEDVHLKVVRGVADLVNEHGSTTVHAGQRAVANAAELPSYAVAVNSADLDDFDRWSEARRPGHTVTESAAYLPEEVRSYSGVLDNSGTWSTEGTYGSAVWYPYVGADWVPYSRGRWCDTPYYGWTWVGIDPWSWPTHHYGRWGYAGNRWYWAPGQTWNPAWVAWGSTPGYVSWAPLGLDGRPVGGFPAPGPSIGTPGRFLDPWSSWTVMPSNQFRNNVWVPQHVVPHNALPPIANAGFVPQAAAPLPSGPAVPRRSLAPLHAPTAPHDNATARPRSYAGPFEPARSAGTTRVVPKGTVTGPPIARPIAADSRAILPMPDVAGEARAKAPVSQAPSASHAYPQVIRGGVVEDRATPMKTDPARAVPRSADQSVPPASSYDPQVIRRVIEAERPVKSAPVAPPPAADVSRAQPVDRTPPPSASAPPPVAVSRGRSSEPSSPPPPSGVKTAPPSAPSSAAPPPSRGGGASGGSGSTTTGTATGKASPPAQAAPPTQAGRGGRGGGA